MRCKTKSWGLLAASLASVALLSWGTTSLADDKAPAAGAGPTGDVVKTLRLFIGTYTGKSAAGVESQGIYTCEMDLASGKLTEPTLAAATASPSFVAIAPSEKFLYAVGEAGGGGKATGVSAFTLDAKTGMLAPLNQQGSGGSGPCHLVVDKQEKCVLVANYGSGSVASIALNKDGTLGEIASAIQHQGTSADPGRQKEPHAHSIFLDAGNRFAFSPDLGIDKIQIYKLDSATSKLVPHDPAFASVAAGSGPRHFAFHTSGKFAYVINEMLLTITAFAYDAEAGKLTEIQTVSTLPEGMKGPLPGLSTAEIVCHPSGKFLYGSNRGHDTIASFGVDQTTGKLTPTGHQGQDVKVPRNFNIDPTGAYCVVCNQDSDSLVVFKIDPKTGALEPTGIKAKVGMPVCVKFMVMK